jgi:hypothetical protein
LDFTRCFGLDMDFFFGHGVYWALTPYNPWLQFRVELSQILNFCLQSISHIRQFTVSALGPLGKCWTRWRPLGFGARTNIPHVIVPTPLCVMLRWVVHIT